MPEPCFIHLRIHSDYSMIDGLAKTTALVKQASMFSMPALAITDMMNLFGLVRFYSIAQSLGIKPIIGADMKVSNPMMGGELVQLTLLATSNLGYRNLTLLISRAYQRGYGIHGPFIDRDWLIEFGEDLIILSGGHKGDVGRSLLQGNKALLSKCLNFYHRYFQNYYYLELTRTGRMVEENYLHKAVDLAVKTDLPLVATNDVCFIHKKDFDAHEIRVAIHGGFTLNDARRPYNYSTQQYMRSQEEMCQLFSDIPEALKNSVEIAKRCNVTMRFGEYFLPQYPTGTMTTENFLIVKSCQGLEKRLEFLFPNRIIRAKKRLKYDQRLQQELNVINKMGFPGYFLIVMEFIQWAKDNQIAVGPGRGSGAGSLVAYALKITDIDPLEFDLIFERFLNPERISMPDFDIDFCMERRDEVIDHVSERYGREAVSQIITFGTMSAKAVIRDVGRALGHPYGFVNHISKMVPSDPGITLQKAFSMSKKLLEAYESNEEIRFIIDMARKLEGVIRNASKHAGGVVIAPTKITDFSPLYCDSNGNNPMTQFDKNDVESTGLVKFDFLGLRTLTIIDRAIKMINMRNEKNQLKPININIIPLNDQKSFHMLQQSETTAIFQLESNGIKSLIQRLKPDCFEDIIALVALFRPGPLQSGMVDNFINRKHGLEKISYPDAQWQHESLKSVLEPTYGIILYQEQVMKIAQILAGYTLGGADMLRRAMSKKQYKEMFQQRCIFREGAKKLGIKEKLSMKIFDLVEKFAGYGFNKSHSTAYALLSYQTLWLKSHYPAEFMASVMTADMDNTEKIVLLVDECLRMGLKVISPNINVGSYEFHVNDENEIVYGMGAIKGIGINVIAEIIKVREHGGVFKDIFDFCSRINIKKITRRIIEKLLMSGALDDLDLHRAMIMSKLEQAMKAAEQYSKDQAAGQVDMFGELEKKSEQKDKLYSHVIPWSEIFQLNGERDTLGLYLTGHPITQYLKEIEHYTSGIRLKDICSSHHGQVMIVAGLVLAMRTLMTKRGYPIGICTLDDRSAHLEIILFKEQLDKYSHLLEKDRILIVRGQINFDEFEKNFRIIASEVIDINDIRKKSASQLIILLKEHQMDLSFLKLFRQRLLSYCSRIGLIPVKLFYQKNNIKIKLDLDSTWRISPDNHILNELRSFIGFEQVEIKF